MMARFDYDKARASYGDATILKTFGDVPDNLDEF
jgi:hypothetical protein